MAKQIYYYCLGYLQQSDKDEIFYHLPVTTEVTTDINVAEKWFQNAVHILQNHYGRKLIRIEERKLDYACWIKEAIFECIEPAYAKGKYCLELQCFTHNPCNVD